VRPNEPDVIKQMQALLPQHLVVKRALDGSLLITEADGQGLDHLGLQREFSVDVSDGCSSSNV